MNIRENPKKKLMAAIKGKRYEGGILTTIAKSCQFFFQTLKHI
jgi:hypothetical protein